MTGSSVIVEVGGIGYLVSAPTTVLRGLQSGAEIFLHTTMVVREDNWQIFGFDSLEQQSLFDLLRSVSGVGPKTALAILSNLSSAEISSAVTEEDSKPFESVSGVGSKTAKLINVTLAGKLKSVIGSGTSTDADLLAALQSLGWSEKVALPVVQLVSKNAQGKDLAALNRECLAQLSK